MSEINSNNIILPDVGATSNEPTITAKDIADVKTTIDNVEYTIDKDGNAIDADNKIVFTKQEIEDKNKTSNATTSTTEEEIEIDDVKSSLVPK